MLMFQKVKMNFSTSILFLVLWFCSVTIPIHGEKQGYKMSAFDEYLDFHINKIRMKRQAPPEGAVQKTLIDSITTGDSQNLEYVATQQSTGVTHVREENRKLNKMISDLRIKNANLEARNSQLEKKYQDTLRELRRRDTNHVMETQQLREELTKLRTETEGILLKLQTLMDAKLSLELEIAAYRKPLEIEPRRVENIPNNTTAQIIPSPIDSLISPQMTREDVLARTTYQRTSTGPVAISDVSPEGRFIILENTSSGPTRTDVNLDGWKLRRNVDGKRDYTYNFRHFTLKAGKKVKILARGSASEAGLNDLVFRDEDNWGVGSQVTTSLINDKEEDKASHIQKTLYN